jgi:hypothetical protein
MSQEPPLPLPERTDPQRTGLEHYMELADIALGNKKTT